MADKKKKIYPINKVRTKTTRACMHGSFFIHSTTFCSGTSKLFFFKDSAPRRAVILKSDRDTKEQSKEKTEKEKQPTIILKTREQSTPKEDRPQSPKSSKPISDDGPVPCKIAHNGNKEKRSAGVLNTGLGLKSEQFCGMFVGICARRSHYPTTSLTILYEHWLIFIVLIHTRPNTTGSVEFFFLLFFKNFIVACR